MKKHTATISEMERLHAELAKTLTQLIKEARTSEDRKSISGVLKEAREFLKDNKIEANPYGLEDSPTGQLIDELEAFSEEEMFNSDINNLN